MIYRTNFCIEQFKETIINTLCFNQLFPKYKKHLFSLFYYSFKIHPTVIIQSGEFFASKCQKCGFFLKKFCWIISLFIDNRSQKYYHKFTNLFEKLRTILMKTLIDTLLLCFGHFFKTRTFLKARESNG